MIRADCDVAVAWPNCALAATACLITAVLMVLVRLSPRSFLGVTATVLAASKLLSHHCDVSCSSFEPWQGCLSATHRELTPDVRLVFR